MKKTIFAFVAILICGWLAYALTLNASCFNFVANEYPTVSQVIDDAIEESVETAYRYREDAIVLFHSYEISDITYEKDRCVATVDIAVCYLKGERGDGYIGKWTIVIGMELWNNPIFRLNGEKMCVIESEIEDIKSNGAVTVEEEYWW